MTSSNRTQKLIILALTLLAFLLRAYRLDAQSYWIDEAWTAYWAKFSISEIWHLLQTVEPLPPLYHPSTIYWVQLVGDSEYALRFYSLVLGVMAVPFTYRLGKVLGDHRLGLIAALLMTVAPYQIWHSQEARMYSILTAASVMSMWGFVSLWRRSGWHPWLVYVVGTEWALLTHYHGVVLIGVQGLFVVFTWRRRWRDRHFLAWASAIAAILLLWVPWLLIGGNLLQSYFNWIEQPTLWDTYIRAAIAYSVGELVPHPQAIPLSLVFVGVYILGLLNAARRPWGTWRGPEMLAFLLAFTMAPNLAAWLYGEIRTPVYFERYLIPVQVGYLLTIAAGVLAVADGLRNHLARAAPILASVLTLLLVGSAGWVLSHHYFDPVYAKPDWRAVARTIQTFELPGDAIVITGDGGEKAFNFYYEGDSRIYIDFNSPVPSQEQARHIIADIAATHPRIWYTPYGVDIDATLENWLTNNAYPAWQSWLGRKRLALYGGSATVTDKHERYSANLADSQGRALTLDSVALPAGPIPAGNLLPLTLTWLTTTSLEQDYKLSLRVSNEQGDVFAQSDWPPLAAAGGTSSWKANQPITDRRGLWLPPDIPPGDYVLQLVVYDPTSGQPLGKPLVIPDLRVDPAQTIIPLEALSIPNPVRRSLGELDLVGYALPQRVKPGEPMWLWLYWQAPDRTLPRLDSTLRLSLGSEGESIFADSPLVNSVGPSDSWQPGQTRRAVYHLGTSPRLAGTHGEVGVALLSRAGQIQAETTLAQVALETRSRQFEAPSSAYRTDITLGNPALLGLTGYDLSTTEFAPGDSLPITLYWQAAAEMDINYTVFVQLLDSGWQVVSQVDLQPQAGEAPTTTWLPGEILKDPYTLILPGHLPPGDYHLVVGMYDPVTGRRLPVSTGADFIDLGRVAVQ
jgi:4-amino-4-deoxy-L-arabinose transferase-like glycosyltransferase